LWHRATACCHSKQPVVFCQTGCCWTTSGRVPASRQGRPGLRAGHGMYRAPARGATRSQPRLTRVRTGQGVAQQTEMVMGVESLPGIGVESLGGADAAGRARRRQRGAAVVHGAGAAGGGSGRQSHGQRPHLRHPARRGRRRDARMRSAWRWQRAIVCSTQPRRPGRAPARGPEAVRARGEALCWWCPYPDRGRAAGQPAHQVTHLLLVWAACHTRTERCAARCGGGCQTHCGPPAS